MNVAKMVSAALTLNLALAGTVVALALASWVVARVSWRSRAAEQLRVHYLVMALLLIFAAAELFLPRHVAAFAPLARVWAAPTVRAFDAGGGDIRRGIVDLGGPLGHGSVRTNDARESWMLAALVLAVAMAISRTGYDVLRLQRWRRNSFLIRRIGRVEIYASDVAAVPFSFWLTGRACVVVPTMLIGGRLRIAVAHELQHHRQGDTRWVFGVAALRALCFANPFFYVWCKWISEIQEFACDETLVDQGRVDSLAYARLLVEVAQNLTPSGVGNHGSSRESLPAGATGMAMTRRPQQLYRRIEMMLHPKNQGEPRSRDRGRRAGQMAIAALCTIFVAGASFASSGLVQDRRISLDEARRLASQARVRGAEFPLEINELVLKQLNRLVGTPEGRESIRAAVERMHGFETAIGKQIEDYGLPRELVAVPLIESGYQNRGQDPTHHEWGAGLWMFIETTARNYGLRVDGTIDERLNVEKETDAAMRYLASNHLRFGDWRLAVMAYNLGEARLETSIETFGTRDPWALIRAGTENDKEYLAKLVAAILILKNPETLR